MVEFRLNFIKSNVIEIKNELNSKNIAFEKAEFADWAFCCDVDNNVIEQLDCYKQGKIYVQSFSSMMPPVYLEPQANENILDMCAAPGGKTTQIASMTENKALITACELNSVRFEKLKHTIDMQGAKVNILKQDARNLDSFLKFDKVLLDAPCSGTGTLELEKYDFDKWDDTLDALRQIHKKEYLDKIIRTQFKLLQKAIDVTKQGGIIVYSTCSVLPEENEEQIKKILLTKKVKLEKELHINPSNYYEGFYIAKLIKL